MLLPGLGQFVVGAYRRALVLLVLTAALVLAGAAVVLARPALGLRLLVAILALDTALLGLRLFAVVDAGRSAARTVVAALVVLTVAPHAAAGYLAVRSYTVLDRVFADEEPRDLLPSQGVFLVDAPAPEPEPPLPRGRPLALKLAVSRLLGVRIDYYALANLRGFADLVDALGGVTIRREGAAEGF